MKKFILIPDSFKGTMSSSEVCDIMSAAITNHMADAVITKIPIADGGEGTVEAFVSALGGKIYKKVVKGPFFEDVKSFLGILEDGTGVIEMSASSGLPLAEGRLAPDKTTTYGVGQLILHAIDMGCSKIILGLGGSCTNDGGAGAAAACGIKFLDISGSEFVPVGGTLDRISRIDISNLDKRIMNTQIISMCDIDNPLYGEEGAAYVFAPQKGANLEMVVKLDKNLRHYAEVIRKEISLDVQHIPGSGAAGGLGAAMTAFLQSELRMGIELILDTVGFSNLLSTHDTVFTGEGKIDGQSIRGKVVSGVAARARKQNKPVIAFVGDIGDNIDNIYTNGVTSVFSINRIAVDFSIAKTRSREDLSATVNDVMRLIRVLS